MALFIDRSTLTAGLVLFIRATPERIGLMVGRVVELTMQLPWWALPTLSTALIIGLLGSMASVAESGRLPSLNLRRAALALAALGAVIAGLFWQHQARSPYLGELEAKVEGISQNSHVLALNDLRALPRSSSMMDFESDEGVILEATRRGISVFEKSCKIGQDGPYAVELLDGKLPDAESDAGPIAPLAAQINDASETQKKEATLLMEEFFPMALLVLERTSPSGLLARIFETSLQSELIYFKLAVAPVERGYPELDPYQRKVRVIPMTALATVPEHDNTLNLIIKVSPRGCRVKAHGQWLPAIAGCSPQGPTICLQDDASDPAELFRRARQITLSENPASAHTVLGEHRRLRLRRALSDARDYQKAGAAGERRLSDDHRRPAHRVACARHGYDTLLARASSGRGHQRRMGGRASNVRGTRVRRDVPRPSDCDSWR